MSEATEGGRTSAGRRRGRVCARNETSAGGVVYRRLGEAIEFLLIRDPYGNWGLPKGHIEESETPRDAARREVLEETGLARVRVEHDLPCIDWFFRLRGRLIHKYCHFFLMLCDGGDARPREEEGISACVWLGYEEAVHTISYDNAREVLLAAGHILGLEAGRATS